MADLSQLEIALINKKKADIRADINPLLQQVKQAIPDFTDKQNYVDRITAIVDELFLDSQLTAAILNDQSNALMEAICTDLDPARLIELGLENICT
ncbi:MAG: hypothetical protein ACYS8Y_08585 [Planctomycetota bacterium]|jgi:hypothetical protein